MPMLKAFTFVLALLVASAVASAQHALVSFDSSTKVFRLDGGGSSYVFGVNARGELQQLYWGGRLSVLDAFAAAKPMPEWASFDSSYTNTPQEYAGWGGGLFMEPALKVTFPDGNRDLVLHYQSHETAANGFEVVLKDISRPVFVTLHYAMDQRSGILARWATIENRGTEAVTVGQAAAAS
jgi:alpha-galactosidase